MIAVFANRKNTIIETKYTMSLRSITPRITEVKWLMNEKAATVSTTDCGAQPVKNPSTTDEPDTVSRKHTTAASTNAITWFLVSAEIAAPMARNAPAISKLPR